MYDSHVLYLNSFHLIKSLRSEEHTSELQSQSNLVCRLLLEKKKKIDIAHDIITKLEVCFRALAAVVGLDTTYKEHVLSRTTVVLFLGGNNVVFTLVRAVSAS